MRLSIITTDHQGDAENLTLGDAMTGAENPSCRMEYVVNQWFHSSKIQCTVECEIQAESEDTTRDLNNLRGEVLGTLRAGSHQNRVWERKALPAPCSKQSAFVICCGCKYIGNGTPNAECKCRCLLPW